jgi:hypothetical protein
MVSSTDSGNQRSSGVRVRLGGKLSLRLWQEWVESGH